MTQDSQMIQALHMLRSQRANLRVADTFTQLRQMSAIGQPNILVLGKHFPGDGQGSQFWQDFSDRQTPDDNENVLVSRDGTRWKKQQVRKRFCAGSCAGEPLSQLVDGFRQS